METSRREFLVEGGMASLYALGPSRSPARTRVALVGTGIRCLSLWGAELKRSYADVVAIVGLCDINRGRVEFARTHLGLDCPTFVDFDEMVGETRPDKVLVTTVDSTHDRFIIAGMEAGLDVITEKPLTTDETKCQAILDAHERTGRPLTVTHNYRYSPQRRRMKELLQQERIGRITSVDFHWYLDVFHGADYFRRWHGKERFSGTLFVHKACHHFDLLNWWLDSEPERVYAQGALDHYGPKHEFRSSRCRGCPHRERCSFFWDIEKSPLLFDLYVRNESHDGYLRDGCVFSEEIDIYDKMAAQIGYANGVQVSYSCTTYSPYEGYRIAFNGTRGRLEAWIQERQPWPMESFDEFRVTDNFGDTELIRIPHASGGHGGGDTLMMDRIFRDPGGADPYHQAAGLREGAMAVILGIAARKSVKTGEPVSIASLTSLVPQARPPG